MYKSIPMLGKMCRLTHVCISQSKKNNEKTEAALRLMCELEKGKKSGEEKGWLTGEEVRKHFRAKVDGK